ncbi:MAG: LysE family translocator [Chloroflexota bacterium]
MTDPSIFVRGVVLGFTIAAAVGPISLLVIRRSLAEGRVYGLASGLGVATADGTYGAIAAFGLTALTDLLVDWRIALGILGGSFLLVLAWRTATALPTDPASDPVPAHSRRDLAAAFGSLYALTLTNPLTILSFAALFVGLGVTGSGAAGAALLTLGVWVGSALWWVVLTTVVSSLRTRITPGWLRRVNLVSGVIIGAFALIALGTAVAAIAG